MSLKVGIIGLGLIGGSLAKALREKCAIEHIFCYDKSETSLQKAKKDGVISDYSLSVDSGFENLDIIFVCTPVKQISAYIERLMPFVNKDTIITDVGSTKNSLDLEIAKKKGILYIGGHPMAGSEKSGYEASKVHLFENAYYVITPAPNIANEKIDLLMSLIKQIGAIPIKISADYHDFVVAAISHTPHIIAAALVKTIQNLDDQQNTMHTLAAGGFKDITRIASSNPEMWSSISIDNKNEILKIIKSFKEELNEFEKHLIDENNDDIHNFFDKAKKYRDGFSNRNTALGEVYEIFVDMVDKPGAIATVATMLSVNNINIKNIGIVNNREYRDGVLQIIFDSQKDYTRSISLLKDMNFNVYL